MSNDAKCGRGTFGSKERILNESATLTALSTTNYPRYSIIDDLFS